MTTASISSLRLLRLLVRFRLRHTWNGFRRGGSSGNKWVGLVALVLPLTYVGLFLSAFGVVARIASWPVQVATLVVVVWGLTLASLVSKLTGGDAVVAGTSENEFFMSRPVGLANLVVARALAASVLDFWGALFLLPVLAAVSYVWHLGALGFAVSLLTSVLLQVCLVSVGQSVGLGLLGRVSLSKRRLLATVFGLLSALSVASLWALASFVLRRPLAFVRAVEPWASQIADGPLSWFVRPLVALHEQGIALCFVWLALGLVGAVTFVWFASRIAAIASRRGWEDAGLPFDAAPAAFAQKRGPALSIAGKELRLLVRDRSRFVALLAMPFLFVGVQVFGAAGMEVFGGGPHRAGLLAYSLAAYLATLGPLPHMQSERRAFWVLRSVPVSLGWIMWGKAKAWLLLIVGVGVFAFAATVAVGGGFHLDDLVFWKSLALVVVGSAMVCVLAIGVGCNAADLSDEGRNALGPGGVYVFLMVAGLFNLALLREGTLAWRTLVLYAATVVLVWATGIRRAETALDPGRLRPVTPSDGALATLLLFCGVHLISLAPAGMSLQESNVGRAVWAALVAVGSLLFLWSVRRGMVRKGATVLSLFSAWRGRGWLRVIGVSVACVAAATLFRLTLHPLPTALVMVLAEEVVFRAILQRALQAHFHRTRNERIFAVAASVFVATAGTVEELSVSALLTQVLAVSAFASSRSLVPSVLGRMSLFLF
jgi:membrane protease YdiL (CAAX protease family)